MGLEAQAREWGIGVWAATVKVVQEVVVEPVVLVLVLVLVVLAVAGALSLLTGVRRAPEGPSPPQQQQQRQLQLQPPSLLPQLTHPVQLPLLRPPAAP